jgi:hypothetical protein
VRCSSEFPFAPGAQRAIDYVKSGALGRVLEIHSGFLHSSDLDPAKPANWKRHSKTCGEIGVMGDLGMHTVHIPFRLGWKPQRVFAQLQKGFSERPDGQGGTAECDTWDNATLNCDVEINGQTVPMRLQQKRLAPGQTNSWHFEANTIFIYEKEKAAGPASTSATRWPSPQSPAEFSKPASPTSTSNCGPPTPPNAPEN